MAPTTRAIWGPATIRNSSELTVASASAAPKPHSASRPKASAGSGTAAITSSGAPKSTSATVRGAISEWRSTSRVLTGNAMSTPIPAAAISTPTPDSSRPIRSSATTVVRVSQRPRTNERIPETAITRATRESIRSRVGSLEPATPAPVCASAPGTRLTTETMTIPATAITSAATRKVAAAPATAMSAPPARAPPTWPAPLTLVSRATAAVSSEGVRTSPGSSRACAG